MATRVIFNADDFGASPEINAAVAGAHDAGVLTSASLMVTGDAWEAAVDLARARPRLGVGLHLTLTCGRSALPPAELPGLVDPRGCFRGGPVRAGLRYFFRPGAAGMLAREIAAQFARFAATGLPLDHVNGHLHLHLHPRALPFVLAGCAAHPRAGVRLVRDPFRLNACLARGRWGYRVSHAAVFRALSAHAEPRLRRAGVRVADAVFGLLQNGRMDEDFLLRLLPRLPSGLVEVYSHPTTAGPAAEFRALTSLAVRESLRQHGHALARYSDPA